MDKLFGFPFPVRLSPAMPHDRLFLLPTDSAPVVIRHKDRPGFERVLARILDGIDTLSSGINAGALTVDAWQREMAQLLLVGHVAAYQEGREQDQLSPGARRLIAQIVGEQVDYLNGFADKVAEQGWDDRRDRARAALYAGSTKQAFSRGATFGLPLPFHPGDGGSECLGNCYCRWEIVWLDQEELDADCYWRLGGRPERHCTTCPSRAANNPYKVRGGELVD